MRCTRRRIRSTTRDYFLLFLLFQFLAFLLEIDFIELVIRDSVFRKQTFIKRFRLLSTRHRLS